MQTKLCKDEISFTEVALKEIVHLRKNVVFLFRCVSKINIYRLILPYYQGFYKMYVLFSGRCR